MAFYLRHFTFLIRLPATNSTLADLVLEHWVIGRTGAPKLLPGKNLANIDQQKGNTENTENDRQDI